MPFTNKVKLYKIDLTLNEKDRWKNVIENEMKYAKLMIKESKEYNNPLSKILFNLGKGAIGILYRKYGGLYVDEMKSWADALNISLNEFIALNCQYELNHLFACTAAAYWNNNLGMVHIRNMDWEIDGMGKATRIFEFVKGKRRFVTVGVPGQICVISGMLPHKYSITMNYAPTKSMPSYNGFGPLFLLRNVFETCNTFNSAVRKIKNTRLVTNALFLVCGLEKGQACVIERTKREARVRYIKDSYITLGNHFKSKTFAYLNSDEDLPEDSNDRECAIENNLLKLGNRPSILKIAKCLDTEPVLNEYTSQQMVFIPKIGEYKIWRRI